MPFADLIILAHGANGRRPVVVDHLGGAQGVAVAAEMHTGLAQRSEFGEQLHHVVISDAKVEVGNEQLSQACGGICGGETSGELLREFPGLGGAAATTFLNAASECARATERGSSSHAATASKASTSSSSP